MNDAAVLVAMKNTTTMVEMGMKACLVRNKVTDRFFQA